MGVYLSATYQIGNVILKMFSEVRQQDFIIYFKIQYFVCANKCTIYTESHSYATLSLNLNNYFPIQSIYLQFVIDVAKPF